MAEIERLIDEFAADYEAGRDADPAKFLDRVEPGRRQELAERLDRYLMTAPTRRWDPKAFEGSLAQRASDRVYESLEGVSGTWPELLPHLRNQARIKRRELVERLAGALGFDAEPQIEKVGDYYNRMEHGRLPATGVSGRVIDALAGVLGTDAERIRAAGSRIGEPGEGAQTAFARTASPDAELADADALAETAPPQPPGRATHDEIDALFLDG
ncbi:MAG TPA: hypothetical protein VHI96_04330 [Solirubrobacterales bacterium]|nr:hypothetical protein [Solirubrobacterales bacterium]